MTPKDLEIPLALNYEGCFLIKEKFFFRPRMKPRLHLEKKPLILGAGASFDWHHVFPLDQSLCIEYCSGNGDWVIEQAEKQTGKNWIAIEKRLDRARKIWSKMKNAGINNLFIVCCEGGWFTKHYLMDGKVEVVHVNFPDPWPKDRHSHNRIFNPEFLEGLQRIVIPGGKVNFVTDDDKYRESVLELFRKNEKFVILNPPLGYAINKKGYGNSYFKQLWKEKNRELYYMEMSRNEV
jgi:tRNA (guanine-N7-)-methyltransferase